MNNLDNYKQNMLDVKEYIENYPLEITEGTKKVMLQYKIDAAIARNSLVKSYASMYEADINKISEFLKKKLADIMPKPIITLTDDIDSKLNNLKELSKLLNPLNDSYQKLGLSKIVTNLTEKDSNLQKVNLLLFKSIYVFEEAGIKITFKDFNYSYYTLEYMEKFFENKGSSNFEEIMKENFDKIYWNCPNILIHLKLSVKALSFKYQKKLDDFCQKKRKLLVDQTDLKGKTFIQYYDELSDLKEARISQNPFNLVNRFLNKDLALSDYLPDSQTKIQKINKFVKNGNFTAFTEDAKEKFYLEIIELRNILLEIENYNTFKILIKDVIDRYNLKSKNAYKTKLKEIKKIEKLKDKKLKKYLKQKDNSKKAITVEILNKEISDVLINLNDLYSELEDAKINDVISSNINVSSTILDASLIISSYYEYLKKLVIKNFNTQSLKDTETQIHKFYEFANNPNRVIINHINLFDTNKIEEIIYSRCQLLNINISLEDITNNLETLKKDINFIIDDYNIQESSISLDTINVICELSKKFN